MKNIYLIDYENVGRKGLDGIETLKLGDRVVLFFYEGAGEVPYDILARLAVSSATVSINKITVHTKNAMDFQICTVLGYLISELKEKANYYIISYDKGYNAAIECVTYHLAPLVKVCTIPTISNKSEFEDLEQIIKTTLRPFALPNKFVNHITKSMLSAKTEQSLHLALQKLLKSTAGEVYQALKPIYLQLR